MAAPRRRSMAGAGRCATAPESTIVPEVNNGQLAIYLRAKFPGIDPLQHNRINGKALKISELVAKVTDLIG